MEFFVISVILAALLVPLCMKKRMFIESLVNKHVFVTGGSSGIGYEIAKKALVSGAFVTIAARNRAKLHAAKESLMKECVCSSSQILVKELDVGDFSATKRVIDEVSKWKPIDVLVCNAGLIRAGLFGECTVEDIDQVVRTNFLGCVYCIHAALPYMKSHSAGQGKSIVLVGSLAGLFSFYGSNIYTATKYALRGLAETLKLELYPHDIRVSLICPGFTETPMLDDASTDPEILEIQKTVCHFDRKNIESAADVALKTISAVTYGDFLVPTRKVGSVLAMLTRGLLPSESVLATLAECVAFVPVRLFSYLILFNIYRVLNRIKK